MSQVRLDAWLVNKSLASSRERSKELIKNGQVLINGLPVRKPSYGVDTEDAPAVEIVGETLPYVSRGGLKLAHAIKAFSLDLSGLRCLDAGASTGGFTDCMLQSGADQVFAVDVGTLQLSDRLRKDPRVSSFEQMDIRKVTVEMFGGPVDFISVDVSFISLTNVLPFLEKLLKDRGRMVCLIKPQFEVGRKGLSKKGIVRDPGLHKKAVARVEQAAADCGLIPVACIPSPVTGGSGNREFLLYLRK